MAGTGKSTVSRTVAQTFTDHGQLGGSFFKRGKRDRENASLLFTTIVHELVRQIPKLRPHIHKAIDDDPGVAGRTLKEQFDKLIFQPLIDVSSTQAQNSILVIDALDECDRDDIRIILSLLRRLSQTHTRVFLTSRPELPIRLGFAQIRAETHRDVILHNIPPSTIQDDISVYLKDEFARIRDDHQYLLVTDQSLAPDWPGAHKLCRDFRDIVGSIVLLANLLSTLSLAKLLHIEKTDIDDQLRCLHSVLWVPSDPNAPVHLLHLFFREFLTKKSRSDLG